MDHARKRNKVEHPDAYDDLDRIWEFIAEHNLDAADRVIADIRTAIISS